MSGNLFLVIAGIALFWAGIAVSGSGSQGTVGNTAVSVFGSIRQTFHNSGSAIVGARAKTPRDWIGWSISGVGVLLGLIGLLR